MEEENFTVLKNLTVQSRQHEQQRLTAHQYRGRDEYMSVEGLVKVLQRTVI